MVSVIVRYYLKYDYFLLNCLGGFFREVVFSVKVLCFLLGEEFYLEVVMIFELWKWS